MTSDELKPVMNCLADATESITAYIQTHPGSAVLFAPLIDEMLRVSLLTLDPETVSKLNKDGNYEKLLLSLNPPISGEN